MGKKKKLTSYSGLEYNQKWIVDDLAKGKRTPADIDWLQVSNGSVDNLKYIAYALQEKAGNKQAVEMVECALYQSKIDSKASEDYVKRVSALLEYLQKIESRYQQPADSGTDQPAAEPTTGTSTEQQHPDTSADGGRTAATFTIPQCLQSEQAEKMLSALEKTTGYKGLPVLDRSVTPWRVSSQTDWGYVAEELTKRLNLTDSGKIEWQMWADLAGKERNRLRNAYRDSKASGGAPAGSNAILTALNRLK